MEVLLRRRLVCTPPSCLHQDAGTRGRRRRRRGDVELAGRLHHRRAREEAPPLRVEDQVVGDRHLVALLLLEGLLELLPVEADLHHHLHQHVLVDRPDLRHDLVGRDGEVEGELVGEPAVPPDLGDGDALQRVDDKHPGDEVLDLVGHVSGESEDAALDLLEEVWDVLVVEGQGAAQQGVQDDAARPDVHLRPRVELARDDLRRGVVRRAARRLEEVAVLHHV
mmetsp:Transcript_19642/g.63034  ORF Transcript_19642/g.63034 Transcript_19642/m.63034 type:complete len:223 (+) Transcript_19642:995-1663(+)